MPVRDFAQAAGGEWASIAGDFSTVSDEDACLQGVDIRLGMVLGDCFLDDGIGVDYPNKILVKQPDELLIRALLTTAISGTPDVTNVVGAQLVDDGDRNAAISYQIDTVYSKAPLSGQVGVPQ